MRLIIDIPDKYTSIHTSVKEWIDKAGNACKVRPLPSCHGRLIDADALTEDCKCYWETEYEVNNAPTIIEAYSEESDDIKAMLEHLWNATAEDHRKYSEVDNVTDNG